jgi:hypothetical protein
MKTLSVLALIQLALLAFLAVKLSTLEQSISGGELGAFAADATAGDRVGHVETMPPQGAWEASLRRIVREEMAAAARAGMAPTPPEATYAGAAPAAPLPNPQHLAAVSSQLDYFIGVGSISPSEMAALQSSIARLDDAGRRTMLGKLVRAINTGALKGEL